MKPTPLERFWDGVYRIGFLATAVWLAGLVLYVLAGALLVVIGSIELPYPVLSLDQDPGLYLLAAGTGLSISISMVGRIFSVMLAPNNEEDVLVIVILGSIVIGFGMATLYHSARMLIRILELLPP